MAGAVARTVSMRVTGIRGAATTLAAGHRHRHHAAHCVSTTTTTTAAAAGMTSQIAARSQARHTVARGIGIGVGIGMGSGVGKKRSAMCVKAAAGRWPPSGVEGEVRRRRFTL